MGMRIDCNPDLGYVKMNVKMTQPGFIDKMVGKFEEWLPYELSGEGTQDSYEGW